MDIPTYLGYAEGYEPEQWLDFVVPVYKKNIESVLALSEKYGYITSLRINKYDEHANIYAPFYMGRISDYDKQLIKMAKREVRRDNMPQSEYDMLTHLIKNREKRIVSVGIQYNDYGLLRR